MFKTVFATYGGSYGGSLWRLHPLTLLCSKIASLLVHISALACSAMRMVLASLRLGWVGLYAVVIT